MISFCIVKSFYYIWIAVIISCNPLQNILKPTCSSGDTFLHGIGYSTPFEQVYFIMVESLEGEIWKDIEGYESLYQISNYGRVLSFPKPKVCNSHKIMKQACRRGYMVVGLHKNKKQKFYSIHRLIAKSFIPNPDNKPEINHKDGIRNNNKIENLEWATRKENANHAVKTGLCKYLGEGHHLSKFTKEQVLEIRSSVESSYHLARIFNVTPGAIKHIKRGRNWKHI